jgi:hypothetical protein
VDITGVISSLGSNPLTELLGGHPIVGGLVAVLAAMFCLGWDYFQLGQGRKWFGRVLVMRRIGVVLAVISVILMVSRFTSVWAGNGF